MPQKGSITSPRESLSDSLDMNPNLASKSLFLSIIIVHILLAQRCLPGTMLTLTITQRSVDHYYLHLAEALRC